MPSIFERAFWRDTVERVASSAAQGFLVGGGLGGVAEVADAVDARYLPWMAALGTAGGMAVATFAKCIMAARAGNPGTASFSKAVEPVRPG